MHRLAGVGPQRHAGRPVGDDRRPQLPAAGDARGAHDLRYAICTPVVESTRSAASSSDGQQHRLQPRAGVALGDGGADGVDALAVGGLEVARRAAEHLGHVAGGGRHGGQVGQGVVELAPAASAVSSVAT